MTTVNLKYTFSRHNNSVMDLLIYKKKIRPHLIPKHICTGKSANSPHKTLNPIPSIDLLFSFISQRQKPWRVLHMSVRFTKKVKILLPEVVYGWWHKQLPPWLTRYYRPVNTQYTLHFKQKSNENGEKREENRQAILNLESSVAAIIRGSHFYRHMFNAYW